DEPRQEDEGEQDDRPVLVEDRSNPVGRLTIEDRIEGLVAVEGRQRDQVEDQQQDVDGHEEVEDLQREERDVHVGGQDVPEGQGGGRRREGGGEGSGGRDDRLAVVA